MSSFKMTPISHAEYLSGKYQHVSSSSGNHEAKIWYDSQGNIDEKLTYSRRYLEKKNGSESAKTSSKSKTIWGGEPSNNKNKENKKMKDDELKQSHKELINEIKDDLRAFKAEKDLSIEEKIGQIQMFENRIFSIHAETKEKSIETMCGDLEEQVENMYLVLPIPASAEEQMLCLRILRKNHESDDGTEAAAYMKKIARKAREQYPEIEELQAIVDKIIAPRDASFLKKMWIEQRSLIIVAIGLLFCFSFFIIAKLLAS